jgi:hypothetical protein
MISATLAYGSCAPRRSAPTPQPTPVQPKDTLGPLEAPQADRPAASDTRLAPGSKVTKHPWPAVPKGWSEMWFDPSGAPATSPGKNSGAKPEPGIRFFKSQRPTAPTPLFASVSALDRVVIGVQFSNGQATSQITKNCRHGINGGYFSGTKSLSIVKSGGTLHSVDAQQFKRPQGKAAPTRGALFWNLSSRSATFTWASVINGAIKSFAQPADPFRDQRKGGTEAPPHTDALGAGPLLLKGSQLVLNPAREAFDQGIQPNSGAPRTAVGVTGSGFFITLVADGRNWDAPGLTLSQLAGLLKLWGVTDGLNLDGGGSSTFVVSGRTVNRPSDGAERAVTSALCLRES